MKHFLTDSHTIEVAKYLTETFIVGAKKHGMSDEQLTKLSLLTPAFLPKYVADAANDLHLPVEVIVFASAQNCALSKESYDIFYTLMLKDFQDFAKSINVSFDAVMEEVVEFSKLIHKEIMKDHLPKTC